MSSAIGVAPAGAVPMEIRIDEAPPGLERPAGGTNQFSASWADLALEEGAVRVTRAPLATRFSVDRPLDMAAIIHPYLSFPAAIASNWLGRASFHAGAVAVGDSAVALVGDPAAGKSSTLAACARAGMDVLTDDLLVLDGRQAYAGPRAVDQRADTHDGFEASFLGRIGARERWRLSLPPLAGTRTLKGFVRLAWADDRTELQEMAASERIPAVIGAAALGGGFLPAEAPLQLSGVPWWELRRRRDLGSLDDVVTQLGDLVASL